MNTYGTLFRLTTFGESHGPGIGGVIDGCPPNIELDLEEIQQELDRRRPGQSKIVTQRKESDQVEFLSGIFEGKTTGTPIAFFIRNHDAKSKDYGHLAHAFRPSHADYTYTAKYGIRDYRGGGRSSARETAARVVAGAIAKQVLRREGIKVWAYVSQVGEIALQKAWHELKPEAVEGNEVRCPDAGTAEAMISLIRQVRKEGDTIGGVVSGVIEGVPPGLGEPVFDKLHAELAKAMMSINAAKGFEYGSGFEGVKMRGSQHNDLFYTDEHGRVRTRTNYSGGIQGGISNGEAIYFRVAFKPVATLMRPQESINEQGEKTIIEGKGRHDPCVVPRAVPIVESMAAIVILDFWLRRKAYESA